MVSKLRRKDVGITTVIEMVQKTIESEEKGVVAVTVENIEGTGRDRMTSVSRDGGGTETIRMMNGTRGEDVMTMIKITKETHGVEVLVESHVNGGVQVGNHDGIAAPVESHIGVEVRVETSGHSDPRNVIASQEVLEAQTDDHCNKVNLIRVDKRHHRRNG